MLERIVSIDFVMTEVTVEMRLLVSAVLQLVKIGETQSRKLAEILIDCYDRRMKRRLMERGQELFFDQ